MRSEWPRCLLKEVAAGQSGSIAIGPFGSRLKTGAYTEHGVALIRGANLAGSKFLSGDFVYISEETARGLGNANVKPWDLVFPHRGNIGAVGLVPENGQQYALSTSLMKVTLDRRRIDPLFLYYFFRSDQGQAELLKNASQVGTPGIATPLTSLRACVVPVPPIREQIAAAQVLSLLDDRINLFRQASAALEAIAQALFKSWFIDFDPVRAKAEDREPEGMDAQTAALFPDAFEESELGLIPRGWRVSLLSDAMEINPSRSLRKGVDAPYLEMASAPTRGHRPLESIGPRPFGSGSKFRNGDALLAKITPCLENGKTVFVDFLEDGQVGWGSTEFIVLRSKAALPEYCAYLLARHGPFRQFAEQAMTGTSGRQRIELSRLAQFSMALPPDAFVAQATAPVFSALQARIAANDEEALTLAALRDALLPRLMSGKLRLSQFHESLDETIA